jgi:hypothetical protein
MAADSSTSLPLPPPGTQLSYVVLHHTGIADPHFDLMLLAPGCEKLLTWRITTPPTHWPPISAERIADHRKDYLTFEGEISNNRGTVKRVAQGKARVTSNGGTAFQLALEGDVACEITLPRT